MSSENLSKEQIINTIEKLEKNPNDKVAILTDIGVGAAGAVGAGIGAALLGSSTVPVLFGLITIPVAAPLLVVFGGATLGVAALVGAKKFLFDGTFTEGKQSQMLIKLKEDLREVEAKERVSKLGDSDKTKFIVSLKEPVTLNLISPKDAQDLIQAVENGQISLKDAIKMVEDVIKSAKIQ